MRSLPHMLLFLLAGLLPLARAKAAHNVPPPDYAYVEMMRTEQTAGLYHYRMAATQHSGNICLQAMDHAAIEALKVSQQFHDLWVADRNEFYKRLGMKAYEAVCDARGMTNMVDFLTVDYILKLFQGEGEIQKPKKVLVIGPGYGRDLRFLFQFTSVEEVWVVESSPEHVSYLRNKFELTEEERTKRARAGLPHNAKFFVTAEDLIRDPFPHETRFDVILASFGTMLEFTPLEWQLSMGVLAKASHPKTIFLADAPIGKTRSVLDMHRVGPFLEMRPRDMPRSHPAARLAPFKTDTTDIIVDIDAFIANAAFGGYWTLDKQRDIHQYMPKGDPEFSARAWFSFHRTAQAPPPINPPQILRNRPTDWNEGQHQWHERNLTLPQ